MDILDRMNEFDFHDIWRLAYAEICLLRTQNEELRNELEKHRNQTNELSSGT